MKRILAAVDGSADSTAAALVAAAIARATSAQLELVFVVEPGPRRIPLQHAEDRARQAEQEARAARVFEHVEQQLEAKPVRRIERGGPAERLEALAADPEVTMVVAGARGHHSVLHALTGGASQRLLATCPKTVLIVRAGSR